MRGRSMQACLGVVQGLQGECRVQELQWGAKDAVGSRGCKGCEWHKGCKRCSGLQGLRRLQALQPAPSVLRPRAHSQALSLALRILSGSPDVPGRPPHVVEAAGLPSALSLLLQSCPTTAGPHLQARSKLSAVPRPSPPRPAQCRGSAAVPEQQPGPIMWLLMKSRPWQSDDIVP